MQKNDYISQANLSKSLNIMPITLNLYLCRAEFSHIFQFHIGRYKYYKGFSDKDIERLRELTGRGRGRKNANNRDIRTESLQAT